MGDVKQYCDQVDDDDRGLVPLLRPLLADMGLEDDWDVAPMLHEALHSAYNKGVDQTNARLNALAIAEASAQGEAGTCAFETALRLHLGWLDSKAEHFKQNRQVGHTFRECASRLRATLAELPGDDESALPPPPKAEP